MKYDRDGGNLSERGVFVCVCVCVCVGRMKMPGHMFIDFFGRCLLFSPAVCSYLFNFITDSWTILFYLFLCLFPLRKRDQTGLQSALLSPKLYMGSFRPTNPDFNSFLLEIKWILTVRGGFTAPHTANFKWLCSRANTGQQTPLCSFSWLSPSPANSDSPPTRRLHLNGLISL